MGNPFTAAVRGKTAEFVSLHEWLHGLLTFTILTLMGGEVKLRLAAARRS